MTKSNRIAPSHKASGGESPSVPEWKVHLPLLIQETLSNPHMGALKIPYRILQSLLIELARRTMRTGDVAVDEMMIRLAIYSQGDPHDPDHAQGTARSINEERVRERHAQSDAQDVECAIAMAHLNTVPDLPTIGTAVGRAWESMPFASRVAVALDAIQANATEEEPEFGRFPDTFLVDLMKPFASRVAVAPDTIQADATEERPYFGRFLTTFQVDWMKPDYDWLRETALHPTTTIVRANRLAQGCGVRWHPAPEGMSALGYLVSRIEDTIPHGRDATVQPIEEGEATVGRRLARLEKMRYGETLGSENDLVVQDLMKWIGFEPFEDDAPDARGWILERIGMDVIVERRVDGWSISRSDVQGESIPHASGLRMAEACIRIHLLARGPRQGLDKARPDDRILAIADELGILESHPHFASIGDLHAQVRSILGLPGGGGRDGDQIADTEIAAYGVETNG